MRLTGSVANDASGAMIEIQGGPANVERFIQRLPAELPPLAQIVDCVRDEGDVIDAEDAFVIGSSTGGEMTDAQVTVDAGTCYDCLAELADPDDPRHAYPFINCTNCGPRYSIVTAIPYDRPNTTMTDFQMCRYCAGQYGDPADRRFHAQPIACPTCGPSCRLTDPAGRAIDCDDPIAEAARRLGGGEIVAVKGLGGFHLACRADDEHVVRRLRQRKHRDAKPFALMVRDPAAARALCEINADAEALLAGPIRPIVLLPKCPGAVVAESVAPGLNTLGLMLPYTALHHLLLAGVDAPLVMTSGNVSDEPLTSNNDDAVAHLGAIADAMLLHDRRIERPLDDSVAQGRPTGPVVFRRARGYAPRPVQVSSAGGTRTVLAVGAELKSTVCLLRDGRALIGEHVGDLKDARTYRRFVRMISDLEQLFELTPDVIAADLHPAYLSTEYALKRSAGDLPGRPAVPIVRVQHHHAHVVSVLVERGVGEELIGIVADGTGYGPDGAIWGCEILRASAAGYERLGHLRYFPLPGGDAAARQTARPALALLAETFGPDAADLPIAARLADADTRAAIFAQLSADVNCPPTSSLGRFFDAAAALTGIASENRYEAQAPMLLESAVDAGVAGVWPFDLTSETPFLIDYRPAVRAFVEDDSGPEVLAAKFHNTIAAFLAAAARRARELTGLRTVALSGGCMANRVLSVRLEAQLAADGFTVLTHRDIPTNDGGVALGQAVIAAEAAK